MLLALIIVAMFVLAILELWLFWMLGEHQDGRRWRPAVTVLPTGLAGRCITETGQG